MLTDTDFWWHIASGDFLRSSHSLNASDPFSFSAGNYQWLNIAWLWDVIYSRLNHLSPLYLPVVITAIVNALTLSVLAGFILKRVGPVITIFVILFALVPYSYMLTPRPHEVTFLMSALFYIICWRKKYVPALPPLMIVWANMHGGFFVGFMIIGAYFLQSILMRDKRNSIMFLFALLTCFAASLINPLGINLYSVFNRTLFNPLLPIISEWAPLVLSRKFIPHLIYIALFIITFRAFANKVSIAEKFLSVIWAIAALEHERNLPIFIIFSAPVLAVNLKTWTQKLPPKAQSWLGWKDNHYTRDFSDTKIKVVTSTAALVMIVLLLIGFARPYLDLSIPATNPLAEAEYVKQHYPDKRFLNDYFQGGYLLYIWRGEPKIFIDGRGGHAYPPDVVADYLKFHYQQPGWEKMIDKYNIDGVILPRDNPSLRYFTDNKQWIMAYSNNLDIVYIHK